MIDVMKIFKTESVYNQLKRIRECIMVSGGLFPMSKEVYNWSKETGYDIYRLSKVKCFRSDYFKWLCSERKIDVSR